MSAKARILLVTHALGGGVESHVADLRALLAAAVDVDVLRPAGNAAVLLERSGSSTAIWRADDWPRLVEALRRRGYSRIHVHHVHGFAATILDLPSSLQLPYDLTLHDFYPYCPGYSLSAPNGAYCGEPGVDGCAACSGARPHPWNLAIDAWRAAMQVFLARAQRVIVPSAFVAERIVGHFPGLAVELRAHPPRAEWIAAPLQRVKVVLLGGLARVKGLDVLLACALDAKQRQLPLAYTLLGYPEHAVPVWPTLPLQVRGEYADADLPELLALEKANVLWFPGQIPETYSYTLDVALASGLPIVASALGAIGERLQGRAACSLLPADAASEEWNQALIAAAQASTEPTWPPAQAQLRLREAYANYLVLPLADTPLPARSDDPDDDAALQTQLPAGKELTLTALFEHGVDCGHRESRLALKNRMAEIERDYAVLRGYGERVGKPWFDLLDGIERDRQRILQKFAIEADNQRAQNEKLASEIATVQARNQKFAGEIAVLQAQVHDRSLDVERAVAQIRKMERSSSWRLTAPLRWLVGLAKAGWRSGDRALYQLRQAHHRLPMAMRILRAQGPAALARRVGEKLQGQAYRPSAAATIAMAEISPLVLFSCPDDKTPQVSLVIPTYGQHQYTFNCLKSLAAHTELGAVEVIVVDDAAPEPVATALPRVSGMHLVRNEHNLGFIGSCQRGADLARGEFLILLNNDVQVTEGWLEALLAVFARRADAGLVGARLVYPDGRLQEAGGIVWQDGSAWNWGRGDDPERPLYRYLRSVDYCSGACLALRRADWLALGGFDRAFAPAYYEDTDLAFRVRAAGKRVYYQPEAKVVHFEGVSSGTDESQGVKQHQVSNRKVFLERWQSTLAAHRSNGIEPGLEADRGVKARVLVVEACMITPDQDSGSVRMAAILELLLELGCKVSFVADNLECRQPYTRALQQAGVEVWHGPYIQSVAQLLEERGGDYDMIVFCRHYVAAPYMDRIRQWAPRARIVFDTVDLHYLREERQAELEHSAALAATAKKTRAQELGVMAKSDLTLVVSPVEQALLAREAPGVEVRILSNIHELRPAGRSFAQRKGLLFVGGFRHTPNVDAMEWFLGEVWPLVREQLPGIEVTVVGSNMPEQLRALAGPGVVMAGFVENIDPLIDGARISLAPLRYGAGVKGKINQAMACGLPVVATAVAAEGMGLEAGAELLVADTPQDFAAAVVRLYGDEALWERLAQGGRDNVRRYFSRATARDVLADLLGLGAAGRNKGGAIDESPALAA